jgi:hypothetical protein
MKDAAMVGAYVAALIGGLALYDANAEAVGAPLALWAAASFALGLATARPWLFLVPLVVGIPASLPFGYADSATGGEAYVAVFGAIASAVGAAMVLVGAAARSYGVFRSGS